MRFFRLLRGVPPLLLLAFSFPVQEEFGSAAEAGNLRLDSMQASCFPTQKTTLKGFQTIMQTVAEAWNSGDAAKAASCFAEDAIYSAPPSSGRHGRKELYEYFGGKQGRPSPMHMSWHNLVFDPSQQLGVGEYTFQYRIQTHGIVIVKIDRGLIKNWREYEVESSQNWEDFIGTNHF
jgi:SnoaL-like protein